MVMASADEIYITIRGKGGHAAAPHLTVDTILVASHLVVALQQIISRNRNPFVAFGLIHHLGTGRVYDQCHSERGEADGDFPGHGRGVAVSGA
jgi:acetylornithine deacetylase/succinyl-diaminopimelate desuccinylase-like protein